MKICVWSAALTITVDGLQLDLSELPVQMREGAATKLSFRKMLHKNALENSF